MGETAKNVVRHEVDLQAQQQQQLNVDDSRQFRVECAVCGCPLEGHCEGLSYHYLTHSLLELALALASLQVKMLTKTMLCIKQETVEKEEESTVVLEFKKEIVVVEEGKLTNKVVKEERRDKKKRENIKNTNKGSGGGPSRAPATCPVCGKTLSCRSGLSKHMVLHSDSKPYRCESCSLGFNQQRDLRAHQMQHHSSLRPHQCLICGKGFVHRFYLAEHMTYHTGDREHQCSQCGKRFQALSALSKHSKRHATAKPFVCSICGKAFTVKVDMKAHVKLVHEKRHPAVEQSSGSLESPNSCQRDGKIIADVNNAASNADLSSPSLPMEDSNTPPEDSAKCTGNKDDKCIGRSFEMAVACIKEELNKSGDNGDGFCVSPSERPKVTVDDEMPPPNISPCTGPDL